MARRIFQNHSVRQSWSANGDISLELSPTPFTITELWVVINASITTGAAPGTYNDPWDRIISSLSLSGENKTFFNFTNMRAAYFFTLVRGHGTLRPDAIGASQTNVLRKIAYRFHFGVCPNKLNPVTGCVHRNPYDLTAGIPPMSKGNLTLQGKFAGANAPGSGWTVNDAALDIYFYGVAPEPGDKPEDYLPRAFPRWEMASPTPTSTSSRFATTYNIPSGDFLHSVMLMTTKGANDPRDDQVLESIRVYNQLEGRTIWQAIQWEEAEQTSQHDILGWPPVDNPDGTLGTPTILQVHGTYQGILWLPLHEQATKGHPLYGVDMRNVATGDLQLNYEVIDVASVGLHIVHAKYQLNPNHPANVGV